MPNQQEPAPAEAPNTAILTMPPSNPIASLKQNYQLHRQHETLQENIEFENSIFCKSCEFKTFYKVDLYEHCVQKHGSTVNDSGTVCETNEYHEQFNCILQGCQFNTSSILLVAKHYANCEMAQIVSKDESFSATVDHDNSYANKSKQKDHHASESSKELHCARCDFTTKQKSILVLHMFQTAHFIEYNCGTCSYKTQSKADLIRHNVLHHDTGAIEKLKQKSQLTEHSTLEHDAPDKDVRFFECRHCSYKTKRKSELIIHNALKHLDTGAIEKLKQKSQLTEHSTFEHDAPDKDVQFFECRHCSYKTKRKSELIIHNALKHLDTDAIEVLKKKSLLEEHSTLEHDASEEEVQFTNLDTDASERSKQNSQLAEQCTLEHNASDEDLQFFKCHNCSYKTKRKLDLIRHMSVHSIEKLKQKSQLTKHSTSKHDTANEDVQLYECHKCSYETKRKADLKNHNAQKHLDTNADESRSKRKSQLKERSTLEHDVSEEEVQFFSCHNCSYKSKRKLDLIRHNMSVHSIDKLKQKSQLTKHSTSKHGTANEDVQFYECHKCSYKTKHKEDLKSHNAQKHLDTNADGSRSKQKSQLKERSTLEHDSSDEDVEFFKCHNCSYKTKRKLDLIRHMSVHSIEKLKQKSQLTKHSTSKHDTANEDVQFYECHKCSYKTKHKKDLKSHNAQKHLDTNADGSRSKQKSQLKERSTLEHDASEEEVQFFKCHNCSYKTKRKLDLIRHMSVHSIEKLKQKSQLTKHSTSKYDTSNEDVQLYECHKCSYKTKHKEDLKSHNAQKHLDTNADGSRSKQKSQLKERSTLEHDASEEEVQFFSCHNCSYKTKRKLDLIRHMSVHSIEKLKQKSQLTKHSTSKHDTSNEDVQLYECHKCSYKTKHKEDLKSHNAQKHLDTNAVGSRSKQKLSQLKERSTFEHDASEEDVKFFKCLNCSYKSKRKLDLTRHMSVHATPDRIDWQKCEQCSFKTKLISYLKRHVLRKHADANKEVIRHKCKKCSYETKFNARFKRHMLTHKADSVKKLIWHRCNKCSYKTKRNFDLNKHMMSVHCDARFYRKKNSLYRCKECSFETKLSDYLKKHMLRMHAPDKEVIWYDCDQCAYQTKQKWMLKRHMKKHAIGEKPEMYQCDECPHTATKKYNLEKHMLLTHADPDGVYWYRCRKCHYKSKEKCHLDRHCAQKH